MDLLDERAVDCVHPVQASCVEGIHHTEAVVRAVVGGIVRPSGGRDDVAVKRARRTLGRPHSRLETVGPVARVGAVGGLSWLARYGACLLDEVESRQDELQQSGAARHYSLVGGQDRRTFARPASCVAPACGGARAGGPAPGLDLGIWPNRCHAENQRG